MLKLHNTLSRKKESFKPFEEKIDKLWETNWYQLRDNELLKLEANLLKELINLGVKKAGSLYKLSRLLGMSYVDFWYALKDRVKLVSVKKLRLLALYLGINYDYFNNKILEIRKGKIASIKNPKFPFNLATKEGATILGNIVSDGSIYIDKKARNVKRTKYSAGTKEEMGKFINNINKIFGKVHFQKETIRNSVYLKIGSSIIADALGKVGAPTGNKCEIDCELPWLIKNKFEELKISYLRAIFDDEGTVAISKFPYITLSRVIHINNILSPNHKRILKKIESFMKERNFPTGHKIKSIEIKKAIRILKNPSISEILLETKPLLLVEEQKLFESLGIKSWIRNATLNLTDKGTYSIRSELRICKKEDIIKFSRKINFGLSNKKERLRKVLFNTK